ncbi:hypothetical protein C1H46_008119 [Malus baccata]|uniref:Heme O synthase n=1 Tax=Malus baccata TaxID=106549 RepID=A0A540N711_MALBA|nr:hypothetical protein C1H46_008119 [Malus baccata]
MWKRVVSAPSAQLQTLASTSGSHRSSCLRHIFRLLIFTPSSSSILPYQRSRALSSTHATFTSYSSASAFAMGHEHEEVEAEHQSRINTSNQSGTDGGYSGQNSWQLQQKLNGSCADGSRDPKQSSNQYNQSYNGTFWRGTGNEFLNDPVQRNGNFRGYYGYENGGLQNTPNLNRKQLGNGNIQNPYVSQQEGSIEVRQNPDGFNSQGNSGSQGNPNQNSMQSYAQYQQNTNGHQQNPSYGQYQQNSSYAYGQYQQQPSYAQYQQHPSIGQYQQSPRVGQYQTNSDAFQNTIVDSHMGSESKSEGKLIEASENSPSSSSLEELDRFCKEGKVKEAVEILGLLEKQHVHDCTTRNTIVDRWAAASGQVSLNAMLLPAALYFWQIPHFMALAYLCRDDYAAGGFRMFSLADASGRRTASVALRNCIYMIPLGFLAYDWGMTSGWFCLESTLLTLAIAATSFSFYRDRTRHKARKMFHASLLYLPVFMSGILFHRIVDNQQCLTEENFESSVELSLPLQDGNVNRKNRLRNSTDGTQVRPPVSYASIAPFPFLPVPSYAAP